jgi:penicillin-binding protein 1B
MRRLIHRFAPAAAFVLAIAAVPLAAWLNHLDGVLIEKFDGRRWALPSRIYSDSTLVYPGVDLYESGFYERLERLNYRQVEAPKLRKGDFRRGPDRIEIFMRDFSYPRRFVADRRVALELRDGTVERMHDLTSGEEIYTLELEPELITGLYDADWQQRHLVTLAEVPPILLEAILVTEDRRFFEHHGIDLRGMLRATVFNLRHGQVRQGASTLTQQLMKNFFLSTDRTLARKIQEVALALRAETLFTKNEILECYLNEIYLGQSGAQAIHGIWEASQFYFARPPHELSLAEAALLAGVIQAPNRHSPYRSAESALRRRNIVLGLLLESGAITGAEHARAIAEPLRTEGGRRVRNRAPYFVDFLRAELARDYPREMQTRDGLDFFTTLDAQWQKAAERAVAEGLESLERYFPRLRRRDAPLQAALVAMRPQTGGIVAMVGGRDYASSQFNRAVEGVRQPGSLFKPFVYLTALEDGAAGFPITPATALLDEPFVWTYDARTWKPRNYKDVYLGRVTARRALELSLNAATARLGQQVGLERIRNMAQSLGISRPLPPYPSLILGAIEVAPIEIVRAYAAIANQGLLSAPRSLKRVADASGEVIESRPAEISRVADPEASYLLTLMLEGVLASGTGQAVRELGFTRPAAGKTGTTNRAHDAWFAGFTPNLVAAVWVGFDRDEPLGLTGAQAALPIWVDFMRGATDGYPEVSFEPPPGVTQVRIDPATGELATPSCPTSIVESFRRGREPTRFCPEHGGLF